MPRASAVDLSRVEQPTLPVERVIVGAGRHRKKFGDLEQLAADIEAVGLLHPIAVTPDGQLISGERRLRAVRDVLRWPTIPVHVVDVEHVVLGELVENQARLPFALSELDAIFRTIEPLVRSPGRGRAAEMGKLTGRARDLVARYSGHSGRTVDKAREIAKAAEAEPERFGHLQEIMDRRGKVDGPYKMLRKLQDETRVLGLERTPGKFATLIVDPPWDSDWYSHQVGPDYATMSSEEVVKLDVAAWALENCALYCWVPNNFLPVAVAAVQAWGFQHKSVLTWVKPKWGNGHYFRNQSEHVLFATRGAAKTRPAASSIPTVFEAPIGKHSEKPEEFYDIVRRASFPGYGEAFQRQARPDFTNLFQPIAAPVREAAE